jgi:hypothetical protein
MYVFGHRWNFVVAVKVCLTVFLGLAASPTTTSTGMPSRSSGGSTGSFANANVGRCGPNALYLFLGLQNVVVDYHRLNKEIPPNDHGATLLQLRQASAGFGLHARVVECNFAELERFDMPVIAHLNANIGDAPGHYVVVTEINDRYVFFLDGTTGRKVRYRRSGFEHYWSGRLLVGTGSDVTWREALIAAYFLILISALAVTAARYYLRARGGEWRLIKKSLLVLIAGLLAVSATIRCAMATPAERIIEWMPGTWRNTEHETANCLYVIATAFGHKQSYSAIQSASNEVSDAKGAAQLLRVSKRCGFGLSVSRRRFVDLLHVQRPFLAYVENYRGVPSELVLICAIESSRLTVFRGSSATLETISVDDFRRTWDGRVFVPRSTDRPWLAPSLVSVGTIAAYCFWRAWSLRVSASGALPRAST